MRSIPFIVAILLFLSYFYLYPGSEALIEGRTDTVMSDGTDGAALPFGYDLVTQVWRNHPSRFFYGAIYVESMDQEHGSPAWYPWNERWLLVLNSYLFPNEQLTTAFVVELMVLNGLCMFLLSLYLGWSDFIGVGLAIAWAFNCYTRARAKVHMAMVGIYHLPLIFLGLFLVVRGNSKRSLALAAIAFLIAGTVAHYYLITCVFLSPLFLLFLAFQPEFRCDWKRVSTRMALAVFPLVLFLGWNFFKPLPDYAKTTAADSTHAGYSEDQETKMNAQFLRVFYAHPIDYLGGDLSIEEHGFDFNPVRVMVNNYILETLGISNSHERTQGIRWLILILSAWALLSLWRGRFKGQPDVKAGLIYFQIFAAFTLLLSFSPDFPVEDWGLSNLLFNIFPKVRVASRAGINVHFALLVISGLFLSTQIKWRKFWYFPGVFGMLMVLDYPPIQKMPMAPIAPRYLGLQRQEGPCGIGMIFPFITSYTAPLLAYQMSQNLRGSDCSSLNMMSNIPRMQWMTARFPPSSEFLAKLDSHPEIANELERWARCVPLNWIAFHQVTPREWAEKLCNRLGWRFSQDLTCIAPKKDLPLVRYPDECP